MDVSAEDSDMQENILLLKFHYLGNIQTKIKNKLKWNTESGSVINKEICSAWDKALEAAKRYGDYLTALDAIGSSGSNSTSSGSSNVVGNKKNYGNSINDAEAEDIKYIVTQMKKNSDKFLRTLSIS